MKNKFTFALGLIFILGLMLSGCSPKQGEPAEPVTLRIAVLPILDTLPMYVAQQEGLFAKHGVNVEFVPVASAPERDQVVSAGQADGMINETVSTIFYNKEQTQVQIVRYARVATSDTALMPNGSSVLVMTDGTKRMAPMSRARHRPGRWTSLKSM